MTAVFRKVWLFLVFGLLMNLVLTVTWWGVAATGVAMISAQDPVRAKQVEEFRRVYQNDAGQLSEAESEAYLEAFRPLFDGVDWLSVGLTTSLLGFSCLGLVYTRVGGDPSWVGAFPILSLLTGQNPAVLPTLLENQRLPGHALSFSEQVLVFTMQLVAVYTFGYFGSRLRGKRPPGPPPVPEPAD